MSTRIKYIDLAKGISIFYIIALHTSIYLPLLAYTAMPLFFILSGFFFNGERKLSKTLYGKVWVLIIPLIFFNLIGEAYHYVESQLFTADKDYKFEFLKALFFLKNSNGPLWFLMALFWDVIMIYGLRVISKNHIINIIIISVAIFFIFWFDVLPTNPYYIVSAVMSMPFFYLGYILSDLFPFLKADSRNGIDLLIGISLLIAGTILAYCCNDDIGFHDAHFIGNPIRFYIVSILCSTGLLLICRWIRYIPILNYIGTYSLVIVCFHLLYVNLVLHFTLKFLHDTLEMRLIALSFVCVMCLFTIPLAIKYTPWAVGQKKISWERISDFCNKLISKLPFEADNQQYE